MQTVGPARAYGLALSVIFLHPTRPTRPLIDRYPGAKSGAGVYQAIINEFPPHDLYVEAFVGSGAILLRKLSAPASIVIDVDADVAGRWRRLAESAAFPGLIARHGDARSILAELRDGARLNDRTLIYCDPPYLRSARRSSAPLYRHEMSDAEHAALLVLLATLPARVALSGYRCPLYDAQLAGWRRVDFKAMTRGGPAVESLWCNYPAPVELHESTYLGANFRERERIKRKRARWRRRLAAMPLLERRAMLEELQLLELASPAASVLERDPHVIADDEDRIVTSGAAGSR